MAVDLLERLKKSPVLCDGAMGTLLYSKGVFINRCYDELNLSQPELIRGIHHDYLQAGAELIETNTFGGNTFRLERHGLANRIREINLAGAHLAREAAKMNHWARFLSPRLGPPSDSKLKPWWKAASMF
jgi:homocysteine S-methyltransferase